MRRVHYEYVKRGIFHQDFEEWFPFEAVQEHKPRADTQGVDPIKGYLSVFVLDLSFTEFKDPTEMTIQLEYMDQVSRARWYTRAYFVSQRKCIYTPAQRWKFEVVV